MNILKNEDNYSLVEKIDRELFSSCVIDADRGKKLQAAKQELIDAGESEFAEKIDDYLYICA